MNGKYSKDMSCGAVLCLVAQSCLTHCNPMDYSPPGSSVHGSLQEIMLECVAMPYSRGSSQPRDWTHVSHIASRLVVTMIIVAAAAMTITSPTIKVIKRKKNIFNILIINLLILYSRYSSWIHFRGRWLGYFGEKIFFVMIGEEFVAWSENFSTDCKPNSVHCEIN